MKKLVVLAAAIAVTAAPATAGNRAAQSGSFFCLMTSGPIANFLGFLSLPCLMLDNNDNHY
jgi:hypothetical protein